jgi:hypothetical protein
MASYHQYKQESRNFAVELWDSFWNPPKELCPKCGASAVEYYDPFFFSPVRTLKNRRRIRCQACHFIWRPNRKTKRIWDRFL